MGEVTPRGTRLPREDALKILEPGGHHRSGLPPAFSNARADVVAGLWHPHTSASTIRGESDGQLWIAMDYVNGANAAELLQAQPAGLPAESVIADHLRGR